MRANVQIPLGPRGPGYWDCTQAVACPTSSGLNSVSRGSAPYLPLQEPGTSPTGARQDSVRHLLPPAPSFQTNAPSRVLIEGHCATALPLLLGGGEVNCLASTLRREDSWKALLTPLERRVLLV